MVYSVPDCGCLACKTIRADRESREMMAALAAARAEGAAEERAAIVAWLRAPRRIGLGHGETAAGIERGAHLIPTHGAVPAPTVSEPVEAALDARVNASYGTARRRTTWPGPSGAGCARHGPPTTSGRLTTTSARRARSSVRTLAVRPLAWRAMLLRFSLSPRPAARAR